MYNYIKFSKLFSLVQEAKWYSAFLSPVISEIIKDSSVLDIGTGSGKLIQILINEKYTACTGLDTSQSMLDEAKKKLAGLHVPLLKIAPGNKLPFTAESFNYVTICNVLFNLNQIDGLQLLNESLRLLKSNGKILILSPSGMGAFRKIAMQNLSRRAPSFFIWYFATRNNAGIWFRKNYLKEFCKTHDLKYERKLVFDGLGLLESISV